MAVGISLAGRVCVLGQFVGSLMRAGGDVVRASGNVDIGWLLYLALVMGVSNHSMGYGLFNE